MILLISSYGFIFFCSKLAAFVYEFRHFSVHFWEEGGTYLEKCWINELISNRALLTQKNAESKRENVRFRSFYFQRNR